MTVLGHTMVCHGYKVVYVDNFKALIGHFKVDLGSTLAL